MVMGMALSPDGKYFAIGSWDMYSRYRSRGGDILECQAEIWAVEGQKLIASLDTEGFLQINSLMFSAQGKRLIISGMGIGPRRNDLGRALIWDISPVEGTLSASDLGKPTEFFQEEVMDHVAITDDAKCLATATAQTVVVWKSDGMAGFQKAAILPIGRHLDRLAFSTDGKKLLSFTGPEGSNSNLPAQSSVETWDVTGYQEVLRAPHDRVIMRLGFSSDGELVWTESLDESSNEMLRTWNLKKGIEDTTKRIEAGKAVESAESVDQRSNRFVIANRDEELSVRDRLTGEQVTLPKEPDFAVLGHPFFSPDGKIMARIGRKQGPDSGQALIYNLKGGAYVRTHDWEIHANPKYVRLSIGLSGECVLAHEKGDAVRLFDLKTGRDITPSEIKVIEHVNSFRVSEEGNYLAILSQEGEEDVDERGAHDLLVWDLTYSRKVRSIVSSAWISTYDFSHNSSYLAVGDHGGLVQILNLSGGRIETFEYHAPITAVAFSPDEKICGDGRIKRPRGGQGNSNER
jgi:WD40 repeat protein